MSRSPRQYLLLSTVNSYLQAIGGTAHMIVRGLRSEARGTSGAGVNGPESPTVPSAERMLGPVVCCRHSLHAVPVGFLAAATAS